MSQCHVVKMDKNDEYFNNYLSTAYNSKKNNIVEQNIIRCSSFLSIAKKRN